MKEIIDYDYWECDCNADYLRPKWMIECIECGRKRSEIDGLLVEKKQIDSLRIETQQSKDKNGNR